MSMQASSVHARPNGVSASVSPVAGTPWLRKKEQFLRQCHDYNGDPSKVGFVYAKLKSTVMNYQLRPGERLHAHEFAERLKVSATPVREVLIKLHIEQFIALVPNRGFYSKALDVKEQISLHELAALIMGHAVRQNIVGFEAPDLDSASEAIATEGEAANDPTLVAALKSERVYQQVAALSGNREMIKFMQSFCDRTHCVRRLELEGLENMRTVDADLAAMTSALSRRNAKSATAIISRVLEGKRSQLAALVKEGNSRALAAEYP